VGLCLFVCCVTAGGCVSLCLVYWLDLRHSLMFHVFINSPYITVQRKRRVTSHYFVVLLSKLLR
jgi:hypothetical protein